MVLNISVQAIEISVFLWTAFFQNDPKTQNNNNNNLHSDDLKATQYNLRFIITQYNLRLQTFKIYENFLFKISDP